MLFFFKFVEYNIMPGSGQIPALVFWTGCELCGSLLICSGRSQECHYLWQWLYTCVIPVAWTEITLFLAFLSRPLSPQLFERHKKHLASFNSFIVFFKFCFRSDSRGIAPDLNFCDTRIWGLAIQDWHQGTAALTQANHMM